MKKLGCWVVLCAVSAGCAHERAAREQARETRAPATEPESGAEKEPAPAATLEKDDPPETAPPDAAPSAPEVGAEHGLYHGSTGAAVAMPALVESLRDADLIGFGEIHYHAVGSRMQLELLEALVEQQRPIALAMEFFERDTQKFLDQYLAGEITEEKFVSWSRQKKAYATSHRPLIEFCKERGIPVIAANAPRRLVSEYRKRKHDYKEFLETLSEDERPLVPDETTGLNEDEQTRFKRFMGGHGAGRDLTGFMKSMALWDDAMADSVARFRAENPKHRVLLVVGMFHVMKKMGTVRKYVARRPDDAVRTLIMTSSDSDAVTFEESDKGLGDVVLKVHQSPQTTGAAQ